jgi:hypothetical protein
MAIGCGGGVWIEANAGYTLVSCICDCMGKQTSSSSILASSVLPRWLYRVGGEADRAKPGLGRSYVCSTGVVGPRGEAGDDEPERAVRTVRAAWAG